MEKEIIIPTKDSYKIYGTLNSKTKSNTLLIFAHGLSGNQYEHYYFNGAKFFAKEGFDTFRFDFYARKNNARPLIKSTIATHVKDLESVISNFKNKYQNIVLIGHSIGALVILKSNLSNINKIILWDPTNGMKNIKEKNCSFNKKLDKYVLHWGLDIIISKEFIEEWKNTNIEKLIKNIEIPCKFIFAGNSSKHEIWKPFLIKTKHKASIVKGATHCFYEEGTLEKLFQETLSWLK